MIDFTDVVARPRGFISAAVHAATSMPVTQTAKTKELVKARARAAHASTGDSKSTFRADVADRLGLPRSASNEDIDAALEALNARTPSARLQKSAEDSAFDRVFGRVDTAPAPKPAPLALTDDEAFKRVFGR